MRQHVGYAMTFAVLFVAAGAARAQEARPGARGTTGTPCAMFEGTCLGPPRARKIAEAEGKNLVAVLGCLDPKGGPRAGCAQLLVRGPRAPQRALVAEIEDKACAAPVKTEALRPGADACFGGYAHERRMKVRFGSTSTGAGAHTVSRSVTFQGWAKGAWARAGSVDSSITVTRPEGSSSWHQVRHYRARDAKGKLLGEAYTYDSLPMPSSSDVSVPVAARCAAMRDTYVTRAVAKAAWDKAWCDLYGLGGAINIQIGLQPAGIGGAATYVYSPQICQNVSSLTEKLVAAEGADLMERCLEKPGDFLPPSNPGPQPEPPKIPPDAPQPPRGGPGGGDAKPIEQCEAATFKLRAVYVNDQGDTCTETQTVKVTGAYTSSGECELKVDTSTVCVEEPE